MNLYQEANDTLNKATGNNSTGEVSGYVLSKMEMHEKGALRIYFTKTFDSGKSMTLQCWINPTDFDAIQVFEGQTPESAKLKAAPKELSLFKSLARQFADEAQVTEAFKAVNSFPDLVAALESCVDNAKVGTLVVGYNPKASNDGKHYLSVPNRIVWDGDAKQWLPFFTTKGDKLQGLGNLLASDPTETSTEVNQDEVKIDF